MNPNQKQPMSPEEIKLNLLVLAKEHHEAQDYHHAMWIEEDAQALIFSYCESKNYQINGFPHIKRKTVPEEEQDDYFCRERIERYLNLLIPNHPDVAEMMYLYESLFYVGMPDNLEAYILEVKALNTDYGVDIDWD